MSKKKEKTADLDNLRWIRLMSASFIPKYLVEQVKQRDYSVADFYKYQDLNCLVDHGGGQQLNPFNHLYALVDENNFVKGYLWFVVDPLSKDIVINTFSVSQEYWGGGRAVKKLADHMKFLLKRLKLKKIYWLTRYAKHSQRHGFKPSKVVLMEYTEEQDGKNIDGEHGAKAEHQHADSGAAISTGEHLRAAGT